MTEPIAVDVPAKAPFPRSAPLSTPILPRVDSPPKPEAPKPATATEAIPLTPTTPAPAAPSDSVRGLLARFTKKQLTIGASAVFSLAAGIGAVRLMFPPKDAAPPPTETVSWTTDQLASARGPATTELPKPPSVHVLPASADGLPPVGIPIAPAMPYGPSGPAPSTAKPTGISPIPPPPVYTGTPTYPTAPPTPGYVPPPYPTTPVAPVYGDGGRPAPVLIPPPSSLDFPSIPSPAPSVFPASGVEPKTPPTPGLPPLPALPPGPGVGTPPVTPAIPPIAPPALGSMGPGVPPPPDFGPIIPSAPTTPPPPALPPIPGGSVPVRPAMPPAPVLPPIPGPTAPGPVSEPKPPGVFPPVVDVTPKLPPPPSFDPPVGMGTPAAFTKPGGASDAKPLVPELAPRTDFDVDLYDPKANDSYDSISQEYYNDKRFAAALRAFNQNQPLQGGRYVNVPPIHILKKRFPGQVGGTVPVGNAPSSGPLWGPAAGPEPVPARTAGANRGTFVVPTGGMTMKGIARYVYGTDQRWGDIYGMNAHLRPDEVLPAGTELRMPSDARLP